MWCRSLLLHSCGTEVHYPEWQDVRAKRPPLVLLNADTALLRVKKMKQAADESRLAGWFKLFAEKNMSNLILDLRGNDGGGEQPTASLLSYLLAEPFALS